MAITRKDIEFLDRASKWTDTVEPVRRDDFARLARILRELIGEIAERNSYEDEMRRGDDN